MNRIIKIFLLVFLFLLISVVLFFPKKSFAVDLDVTNIPSTISTTPFSVTVSVLGANAGKNYLRVDLFKEGTTNYFGETHNGSEWYSGSDGTFYFPIDIISSDATATASFQAQIGSPSSTDYNGPGQYKLRIRRYTSASGYSAGNPYDIYIDVATPTPAPTHTPKPTPTITQAPTQSKTATPIPVKTSTPIPLKTVTSKPSPSENTVKELPMASVNVLGVTNALSNPSVSPKPGYSSNLKDRNKRIAITVIVMGFILIGCSFYLALKTSKSATGIK